MEGYEQAFIISNDQQKEDKVEVPDAVKMAMKNALKRNWKHLAVERIENLKPTIPLGKDFWPLSQQEKKGLHDLFENEKVRRLVTSLRSRDDNDAVKVLDAAYWVKGCSSLGGLRYAVLLRVGKKELCLMDVKEAVQAAAPRDATSKMPKDNAERVVTGAGHLSPALGNRMMAARFQDRGVFLRELLPQDLKFNIEQLSCGEAVKAAMFLAGVVGKAHARQMEPDNRQKWHKELSRHRSKTLAAPS